MRCPACGRDGQRGRRERDVRRLLAWLLAFAFTLGACAGIVTAITAGALR